MRANPRSALAAIAATGLLLIAPAIASAAAPAATTLGAAQITITSATLTGNVNPHGVATSYYFQYGTTTAYGSRTPSTAIGKGTSTVAAAAQVTGLAPNTRYHYRLIATNSAGTSKGEDKTFTTAGQYAQTVLTGIVSGGVAFLFGRNLPKG